MKLSLLDAKNQHVQVSKTQSVAESLGDEIQTSASGAGLIAIPRNNIQKTGSFSIFLLTAPTTAIS